MRLLITFVFALFSLPALAAGWGSYENARFGYVIDVPPDFEWGEEAANGDGRVFTSGDGTQTVTAYGGNIIEADFETSITQAMNFADCVAATSWPVTTSPISQTQPMIRR